MFNWADTATSKRFNSRAREARLEEMIRIHSFGPAKKMAGDAQVRFIGPGFAFAEHWFKFKTKADKISPMRKLCLAYDAKTGAFDKGPCPYCEMTGETGKVVILQNAIVRSLERMRPAESPPLTGPEKKLQAPSWSPKYKGTFRFRQMNSESWSPVSVIKLPPGAAKDIAVLASGNKVKMADGTKKAVGPDHPVYGFDILIRYDPNEVPAKMYALQHEGRAKLTDKQKLYTIWKLDSEKPEDLKSATKNAERFVRTLVREDKNKGKFEDSDTGSTDADDEEDEKPKTKKKIKKSTPESVKTKKKVKASSKPDKKPVKKPLKKKKKRSTEDMDD
jgi:hypothetical protein